MGWSTAPLAVRVTVIAVFLAVAAGAVALFYEPSNAKLPLVAFIAIGLGGLAALAALAIGNAVTHPRTREEARFIFSRQPFTGRNRVVLLQFVITVAVGLMAIVNLLAWARHGAGWVAAASSVTFCSVMLYPFIRHRIERGFWPD